MSAPPDNVREFRRDRAEDQLATVLAHLRSRCRQALGAALNSRRPEALGAIPAGDLEPVIGPELAKLWRVIATAEAGDDLELLAKKARCHDDFTFLDLQGEGFGQPETVAADVLAAWREYRAHQLGERIANATDPAARAELARQILEIQAGGTAGAFDPQALDLATMLVTDAPPIPSIVGPYLAREDNALLGGEWGSGKTPLARALAICLVTGERFLGLVPVTSDDTFRLGYLDEENGALLNHYCLNRTVRGMGADPRLVAERLFVFSKQRWGDLTQPRGRDALRRIVDRSKLTHVVLDSLVRFIGDRDENSSSDMSDWYGGTVEFLNREHGCRVVAIHHWRKPSNGPGTGASDPRHRFRGSSDIPAQFDQVLAYDITGEPDARNLIHVRSRWDDYAPLRIVKKLGTKADPHEHLEALDAPATVETLVRNRLLQDGANGTLRQDLLRIVASLGLSDDAATKTLNRTLGALKDRHLAVTKKEGKSSRYWDNSLAPAHAREDAE